MAENVIPFYGRQSSMRRTHMENNLNYLAYNFPLTNLKGWLKPQLLIRIPY